jgi:isopenicillin N synthase-like dioxygenase
MALPTIRTLNLKDFTYGNTDQRASFAQSFATGLKETGFIILEGHGVDTKLIDKNYEMWATWIHGLW